MVYGSKIVELASREVGYSESPAGTNKNKYGKWFGFDGVAWCAIFVSWVYDKAGSKLGNIGFKNGFAGCQSGHAYFKKKGWITETPVEGDIVLFDWNADGRFDHTGIFVRHIESEKLFETIEGNTSSGNNSNGGQVQVRKRNYVNVVFVHPIV